MLINATISQLVASRRMHAIDHVVVFEFAVKIMYTIIARNASHRGFK